MQQDSGLSKRGESFLVVPAYFDAVSKYIQDPFHQDDNPNGIINLGVAENCLCAKEMAQEFTKIRLANPISESTFPYGDFSGSVALRKQLAKLFKKWIFDLPEQIPVSESHFTMANGAGSLIESLCASICDEGDLVMIPSPHYHGLQFDFSSRMKCTLLPVQLAMKKISDIHYQFDLDMQALDMEYENAKSQNKKIAAFIHINPHNPAGMIFDEQQTRQLMQWCLDRKIHFVSDEVYALSLFPSKQANVDSLNPQFVSAIHICKMDELHFPSYRTYVHVVWSFSKDFGLNGFRMGVLYSENETLLRAMRSCAYLTGISTDTDWMVTQMLDDDDFLNKYIPLNQQRIKDAYDKIIALLEAQQIPYVRAQGSMFVFVNLLLRKENTKYPYSFDGEKKLWYDMLDDDCKVYLTPGFVFHLDKPGWFRCCTTAASFDVIEKAWKRIFTKIVKQ